MAVAQFPLDVLALPHYRFPRNQVEERIMRMNIVVVAGRQERAEH